MFGSRVSDVVDNVFPVILPLDGNVKIGREFNVDAYVIVDPKFVRLFPNPLLSATEVTTDDVGFEVTIWVTSAPSNHNWQPDRDVGDVKGGGDKKNG